VRRENFRLIAAVPNNAAIVTAPPAAEAHCSLLLDYCVDCCVNRPCPSQLKRASSRGYVNTQNRRPIRRLKPRLQFRTRVGRQGAEVTASVGEAAERLLWRGIRSFLRRPV
jgi:hypothetical protein